MNILLLVCVTVSKWITTHIFQILPLNSNDGFEHSTLTNGAKIEAQSDKGLAEAEYGKCT
jgi:hypothetical protein